jgi:hypothetical protein
LDLVASHHQWPSFTSNHKELLRHLQHQDHIAPLGSH